MIIREVELTIELLNSMSLLFKESFNEVYSDNNILKDEMFVDINNGVVDTSIDFKSFVHLEKIKMLQSLVIIEDEKIVGYCIMCIDNHDQCKHLKVASCISIYIKKEFRNYETFLFLIDETERRLKEKKVDFIDFSIPEKLLPLFLRRKYHKEQITVIKKL